MCTSLNYHIKLIDCAIYHGRESIYIQFSELSNVAHDNEYCFYYFFVLVTFNAISGFNLTICGRFEVKFRAIMGFFGASALEFAVFVYFKRRAVEGAEFKRVTNFEHNFTQNKRISKS